MGALSRFGWHRIAAIAFLFQFTLLVPLLADRLSTGSALFLGFVIDVVLAVGYWRRNIVALWLGLYVAVFTGVSPLLGTGDWPQPWLVINVVYSVPLVAVAVLAWRASRRTQT
jgi:hypothetical protein